MNLDVTKLTHEPNCARKCIEMLQADASAPVVIFTAGSVAQNTYRVLTGHKIKVACFVDNSPRKVGKELYGIDVVSVDTLASQYPHAHVIVASRMYRKEILLQLRRVLKNMDRVICVDFGFYQPELNSMEFLETNSATLNHAYGLFEDERSRIVFENVLNFRLSLNNRWIEKIYSDSPMYFDSSVMTLQNNEVIVDGGGYIGDTYDVFQKEKGSCRKYYFCEPDHANFSRAYERLKHHMEIEFIPMGLWNETTRLNFSSSHDGSSCLSDQGTLFVDVTSIDMLSDARYPVSFIKLDIEGAEKEALLGAKKTIRQYKPKLAICVYHKPMDIAELPILIKKLNPDYHLYLRHYGVGGTDTVCYAF